jgi:8-oxoguanine DNA-glycosylase Ogg
LGDPYELTLDEPLDLDLCLRTGQVFRWEQLSNGQWLGVDGDTAYRVEVLSGPRYVPAAVGTGLNEDPGRDALSRTSADPIGPTTLRIQSTADRQAFARLFRLEESSADVRTRLLQRGPELQPYLNAHRGLRLLRPSGMVETIFCFLCTANNHLARIVPMCGKLAAFGDEFVREEGKALNRFPTLSTLAEIPESKLRELGFGYRAANIAAVARELVHRGGEEYLSGVKGMPARAAREELCSLKGVGPKLADCMLLFAFHKTEVAPNDTHLWQALTRLYFPEWQGKALTDARYRLAAEFMESRFGDLAAYAHHFLFVDNLLNWRHRK